MSPMRTGIFVTLARKDPSLAPKVGRSLGSRPDRGEVGSGPYTYWGVRGGSAKASPNCFALSCPMSPW
jgi:hypothetical protein